MSDNNNIFILLLLLLLFFWIYSTNAKYRKSFIAIKKISRNLIESKLLSKIKELIVVLSFQKILLDWKRVKSTDYKIHLKKIPILQNISHFHTYHKKVKQLLRKQINDSLITNFHFPIVGYLWNLKIIIMINVRFYGLKLKNIQIFKFI